MDADSYCGAFDDLDVDEARTETDLIECYTDLYSAAYSGGYCTEEGMDGVDSGSCG